ncbi:hypothetical protein ACHQM5_028020 [Ranunculus cassubicifolius]
MSVDFNDEVQALWILGSLPDSWETLAVSLSTAAPDGTLTKEMVSNALLNEDLRRGGIKENGSSSLNNDTLIHEKKGRNKKQGKRNQGKSKGQSKDKKDDQCHYCDKMGHWKSDCYKYKQDVADGTVKPKKNGNDVTIVNQESDLIVVDRAGDVCYAAGTENWVVDSGASFHVIPHKRFFHTYVEGDFGEAMMGNSGV